MNIFLNGENHNIENNFSIRQLIDSLDLQGKRIAVEHNMEIIQKKTFEQTVLQEDDKIEIVHAIGGG